MRAGTSASGRRSSSSWPGRSGPVSGWPLGVSRRTVPAGGRAGRLGQPQLLAVQQAQGGQLQGVAAAQQLLAAAAVQAAKPLGQQAAPLAQVLLVVAQGVAGGAVQLVPLPAQAAGSCWRSWARGAVAAARMRWCSASRWSWSWLLHRALGLAEQAAELGGLLLHLLLGQLPDAAAVAFQRRFEAGQPLDEVGGHGGGRFQGQVGRQVHHGLVALVADAGEHGQRKRAHGRRQPEIIEGQQIGLRAPAPDNDHGLELAAPGPDGVEGGPDAGRRAFALHGGREQGEGEIVGRFLELLHEILPAGRRGRGNNGHPLHPDGQRQPASAAPAGPRPASLRRVSSRSRARSPTV